MRMALPFVGARGLEPRTSRTRTVRASRTALRPVHETYYSLKSSR